MSKMSSNTIAYKKCDGAAGGGGGGRKEGETHWSNASPLKRRAFHPAMDDSMT